MNLGERLVGLERGQAQLSRLYLNSLIGQKMYKLWQFYSGAELYFETDFTTKLIVFPS
jgi:hypothetical protein